MATFKVSDSTIRVLKNFSGISNMLMLQEGRTQKTVAANKSILAQAELSEAWPKDTGIYDLGKFLGAMSLFKNPAIDFKDEHMLLVAGGSRVRYRYADPSVLPEIPNKTLPTKDPAVEFTLDGALQQLNKTCSLLELSAVTVTCAAGTVTLRAIDAKLPDQHAFEFEVDEKDATFHDPKFNKTIVFKQENLAKLLEGPYNVLLGAWKYGFFQHTKEPVSYYIVGQSNVNG